jgi:hypothetical protein
MLGACNVNEDGGAPMLGGEVNGTLGELSFRPGYGIAYEDTRNGATTFRIQLSDAPINCAEYYGASKSAGAGMYARITLPRAEAATFDAAGAENIQIVSENRIVFVKRAVFSNRAKVTLVSVSAESVEGNVSYADQSGDTRVSLDGAFHVQRCAGR